MTFLIDKSFDQQLLAFETEFSEQAKAARASFAAIVEQATSGMALPEPMPAPKPEASEEPLAVGLKPHRPRSNQAVAKRRPMRRRLA